MNNTDYFVRPSQVPRHVSYFYCKLSIVIVFFSKILKYYGLLPFSVFPRCQCVYKHQAGRTPALQQIWQSSEKSQNFKEKAQYLMNPLYMIEELIRSYIFILYTAAFAVQLKIWH